MSREIRVATFNASLNRTVEGGLTADLASGTAAQIKAVAEIIQRNAADIVLINEFDYEAGGAAIDLFRQNYLEVGQNGQAPIVYPYAFNAASNTGIASGFDLDNNGTAVTTPGTPGYGNDAQGFGDFPGQFGFVILSKFPIDQANVRTFQEFLWQDMPDSLLLADDGANSLTSFYSADEIAALRLSSKNHVDVPVIVDGETVHILAAHPTPPVFDGDEDRNGKRNHDEIRLWSDYVSGQGNYIYDDNGQRGGLAAGERFVIVGDYNADPVDGDSVDGAANLLLDNPAVDGSSTDPDLIPTSPGAVEQSALQGQANAGHVGDPAFDTADFADGAPGNLRVDYALPSKAGLVYLGGQVDWPLSSSADFAPVGTFPFPSSDHRLVAVDVRLTDADRRTVESIEYLGQDTFATGTLFEGLEIGGLSGITYDALNDRYYLVADDRTPDARFFTATINLDDGTLDEGDVVFTAVQRLSQTDGTPFVSGALDPEGIALGANGRLYISSEGDANALVDPFVAAFGLNGRQTASLPVDDKFLPTAAQTSGIRNNAAFESLTLTPDLRYLYTATENALYQDGPAATLDSGTASRIIKYNTATGTAVAEYIYVTDAVPEASIPAGAFANNGLVELLALDDAGTLLALERAFVTGVGNTIKLFLVRTQGATDVSGTDAIETAIDDGELEVNLDAPVQKELLLDFADLGIPLDNIEGMSFGPDLPDGRKTLVIISDNNFSPTQFTQVLTFALELGTIPTVTPIAETPGELRYEGPTDTTEGSDPDDPAIYVDPVDAGASVVVTAMKEGGLRVYDLEGNELSRLEPVGIRYNNVDLLYGFELGGTKVDLVVASDRAKDTLAIFTIDPVTKALTNVTSPSIPATIFGVDDGEATAYGLATYTSIVDGKRYAFVTQASGASIAQLEIKADGAGRATAELVRTLDLPVASGDDAQDYQSEGITIDRETGKGYVTVEGELGLLAFDAEPTGSSAFTVVAAIDSGFFEPDLEGVSILYGADGAGALLVSSQGDASFAAFDRQTGSYMGSFTVSPAGSIDGVEESDGLDIYAGALGDLFPNGLLVTQDGSNEPQTVFPDPEDGEVQNFNVNFKFTDLAQVIEALGLSPADADFDPRILIRAGTDGDDELAGSRFADELQGFAGDDTLIANPGDDRLVGGAGRDLLIGGPGADRLEGGSESDALFGGLGGDRYVFQPGAGADRVFTFTDGEDQLEFAGYGSAFDTVAEILATAEQVGGDVRLTLPTPGRAVTVVYIVGIELSQLDASAIVIA